MSDDMQIQRNLKPKEPHPIVPFVQEIFVAAGPDYVNQLMDHLLHTIHKESDTIPTEENPAGVVYDTFRRVTEGEGLNDRYLMGAALYLVASLIPVTEVIKNRVAALYTEEPEDKAAK